jgi:hypothetical protein
MGANMQTVRYTTDGSQHYAVQMNGLLGQVTGTPAKLGVTPGVAGDPRPPKGFKMRTVRCYDPVDKKWRTVVCYTASATLFTGVATTVDLLADASGSGTPITFNRMAAKGESSRAVTGDLYTE